MRISRVVLLVIGLTLTTSLSFAQTPIVLCTENDVTGCNVILGPSEPYPFTLPNLLNPPYGTLIALAGC